MSKFFNSRLASLEAYTPGEQPQDQQYVKLNTNESPFLPSPRVLKAISRAEMLRDLAALSALRTPRRMTISPSFLMVL